MGGEKKNMELTFIEEGRISTDQMNEISGGGVHCDFKFECVAKFYCGTYKNCNNLFDRFRCTSYWN